jgi:hypothetical protein
MCPHPFISPLSCILTLCLSYMYLHIKRYRRRTTSFIEEVCEQVAKLTREQVTKGKPPVEPKVDWQTQTTAQSYFHYFFAHHSFKRHSRFNVAIACVFLAAKVCVCFVCVCCFSFLAFFVPFHLLLVMVCCILLYVIMHIYKVEECEQPGARNLQWLIIYSHRLWNRHNGMRDTNGVPVKKCF